MNHGLCEEQNGFRIGRSTGDHLSSLSLTVETRLKRKLDSFAIFIDFSKAYDRINRDLLWHKLNVLGVDGKMLKSLKSLYEHVQCTVRINGCHSEWFEVQTGLKQGCILSPLLFNSFVNDLIHAIRALNCGVPFGDDDSLSILLYADDIVLLSEDVQQMQVMLNCLDTWCKNWGLDINYDKSKAIHFRTAQVSEILFTILFADDTTVTIQGDNESVLINTLNIELEKLNIWLQANKLTINVSKSHYMIFHRRRRKIDINNPSLNNTVLQRVNYTKFLGVIIDDGLKWTNHIAYVKNKIAKGFGIILRARKFFNRKTLLNLYHAFIFPYLIYCVEIWGNARDIHLLPLITLQKKIVRAITFSRYLAHTAEIFIKLDILTFKQLVIHRIGILMFKNHFECVPSVIKYLFTTNSSAHSYNTRNKHKLRAAYGKHNFMYSNFRFVGIKIWNYITDHLDINITLPKFKKMLKIFIQTNDIKLLLS